MPDPIQTLLQRTSMRHPSVNLEALEMLLHREQWALWATLYVDSSNAGGSNNTGRWGWGACCRISDDLAPCFNVTPVLRTSGLSPQAGSTKDTRLAELWGIYHALDHVLTAWPWLVGIGVRCDNEGAVDALAGCDGRRHSPRGRVSAEAEHARKAIQDLAQKFDILLRGVHVRGHNRAELSRQQAFNRWADQLARSAAIAANKNTSVRPAKVIDLETKAAASTVDDVLDDLPF